MKRPTGVTVIAVLAIIGAVLGVLAALPLLGMTSFGFISGVSGQSGLLAVGTTLGIGLAALWILVAAVQLIFGIGALQLRSWAWTLGVVLFGLTLVMYLVSLFTIGITASSVVGILIAAVVIAYLYSHDVREAFGHLPHGGVTSGTPTPTH